MNVISRGIRNAFRNLIRTFSIVFILALSIGLALTMLIARQAVQAKIDSVKASIGNTITISPAGARGFEGGGEPLTDAEMTKVKALAHVTAVTETLQDRLDSSSTNLVSSIEAGSLGRRNNGGGGNQGATSPTGSRNFTPPVFLAGVNSLTGPVLMGGGSVSLRDGKALDPTTDANVAVVGKSLATKNNLVVGSTFQVYGTTVTVTGIFDAGNTFSNNAVVMPLLAVQRLSQQTGVVGAATVQVDSISSLNDTVAAIKASLGSATADVTSQQDTSAQALAPLENIKSISLYSLVGAVVAGAVIILLTMLMIVRERRREIGVLKAIGSSNFKVVLQFVTEALTFTLLAAAVGLTLGILAGSPVTKLLVTAGANTAQGGGAGGMGRGFLRQAGISGQSLRDVQTAVGWNIPLYGLAAALLITLLGSAIPAWLIAKVSPAEVMRTE